MKSVFKTVIKFIIILILVVAAACGILYVAYNEPLPQGKPGIAADSLASKMLKAINYEAYKDTRYIEWDFKEGAHRYKWDKQLGVVRVEWEAYRVLVNLNYPEKSSVFDNNSQIEDDEKEKVITKAVSMFNNDSFWLVAPFKVYDSGTERSLVALEEGSHGLLVTYTSGGTTPGDSYLWILDDTGFPQSFKMWVDIIPIGGLEATWEGWQIMKSGVFLPTSHQLGPIDFKIENVKAYN
ncbi:MAG: hypothetical protein WBG48_18730 [Pricia sp.]